LDIEYITGVGGGIETEFWGFGGRSPDDSDNEPFMKWLAKVSSTGDADVPKLFSTSYGEGESTWSPAAAQRLNAEFMKAGARGITLLYASGDSGANCKRGKFTPNMPASSPYVTAVGGTEPASGFPAPGSESAVGLSSGGFSNYWATPDWQKDAVAGYLKQSGIPKQSRFGYNTTGRGFPDIAAQATNFCVTPFGCGVAGTSCASPTAAGVFGLLNDLRLQKGKATLGFLNPLLYQNQDAFFDVTQGSGSGCGWFSHGWPATKGWDAVTGLGTPNYKNLAKVVAELGGPAPVWQRKANIVV
jgi:tripeptidyl-peptidase-1